MTVLFLISLSSVCASDGILQNTTQTSPDSVISQSNDDILEDSGNVINIHVTDSYSQTSRNWDEDGFDLEDATVNVYDSSDKLISTHKTNSQGRASITNLGSEVYNLEISYSTYEPIMLKGINFTSNSGTLNIDNVMFVPDILLLVDYASHNEKVDILMNMSKRVAYISTTDFDKSRDWLLSYSNFIHIDMFSESAYSVLTGQYLKELLACFFKANFE